MSSQLSEVGLDVSRMGISSFVSSPSTHAWSTMTSKESWSSMSFPVLEMFFFRRVIFDELHELQGETKGEKFQGWDDLHHMLQKKSCLFLVFFGYYVYNNNYSYIHNISQYHIVHYWNWLCSTNVQKNTLMAFQRMKHWAWPQRVDTLPLSLKIGQDDQPPNMKLTWQFWHNESIWSHLIPFVDALPIKNVILIDFPQQTVKLPGRSGMTLASGPRWWCFGGRGRGQRLLGWNRWISR